MPYPVEIKTDDDGKPVYEDKLPVFKFDDGSESPLDVKGTFEKWETKEKNFNEERDRRAADLKKAKEDLKKFKDIDPEKYAEAMKTITALKDQKLVDEHGVETLKKQMRDIFDEELKGVHESYKKNMTEKDETLNNLNSVIYDLAIKNKFANDKHFTGPTPVTIYNPEDAAAIYGRHFKVEVNGTKYKITATDDDGKPILSKKNHGEPADFHEAISQIISNAAKAKPILRSARTGGPVTAGNLDSPDGTGTEGKSSKDKIKAGLLKYRQGTMQG